MSNPSIEERIAVLEEKMKNTDQSLKEVNRKLDELLTLRYKGVGAFWLASALLGTGIIGALTTFIHWIR